MFRSLLCRALGATGDVTTDLYFRNSCGDLLGHAVKQLAPTVFASRRSCLVIRHGLEVPRLPARRNLIYLIDDDVSAGATDPSLPWAYRQKLRLVEAAFLDRMRLLAGVVVVASEGLARSLRPSVQTRLVDPFWSEPMGGTAHFADLGAGSRIDLAYLGSAVHKADLAFLVPVLADLLDRHPALHIHLSGEHRLPVPLRGHPRVRQLPGRRWPQYRRTLAGSRFHVALYPLTAGPFNDARSRNKLIEHGVVGAAPVYSSSWGPGAMAARCGAGLAIANRADIWRDSISRLIDDPQRMGTMATRAQDYACLINRPEPQRALWHDLLGLGEGAPL